jgi:hypothetical protein
MTSGPVGTTPLFKKLYLQPAMRCLTVCAPAGFFSRLEDLPSRIVFDTKLTGEYDWAMLFVGQTGQLIETLPTVLPWLVEDGLLWIAFIKRSSKRITDLTREKLWNIMHSHGFKAVTHVYIDQDWTAMRFRSLELIGK